MILSILVIGLLIIFGIVFAFIGLFVKFLPYLVALYLVITAIKRLQLLSLYLVEVFRKLYQSVKRNCAQRKAKKLTKQQYLAHIKQSSINCIFVPNNIIQQSTQKQDAVCIHGFVINLVEEKIENFIYPVDELSLLSNQGLYCSFNKYKNGADIIQGITLLHKMIIIRERKILPILNTYQRLATNCHRDSSRMLNEGIIADVEGFERYRDELYDRERSLQQIILVEWQDIVKDIYKAIKLESNCFVVNSFLNVIGKIEELELFIDDCEISKELYINLAYKTFY